MTTPLTGPEARLVLDNLNNAQAALLPDEQYQMFWRAKYKLLAIEVAAEFEQRMPA